MPLLAVKGTATETPETTAAATYFEKKRAEVETVIPDEWQVTACTQTWALIICQTSNNNPDTCIY